MKKLIMILLGIAICLPVPSFAVGLTDASPGVQTIIQARLGLLPPADPGKSREPAQDISLVVREFYTRRDYRPAWTLLQAEALIKTIREADQDGLDPQSYDLTEIRGLVAAFGHAREAGETVSEERQADFDLLLTQTFLKYGLHLSQGRVDPEEWFFQWVPYRRPVDILQSLKTALEKNDVEKILKGLAPRHPSYVLMRQELITLRRIGATGGWPVIPAGAKLKKGDHGLAVALLKRRMVMTGDLSPEAIGDDKRFDAPLEMAVRRFQWRHGLSLSGAIDPETRTVFGVPVEQRIRQLEINMERWRWLPDDFGPRYVMTIIPDFWLYVVDDQKTILSMKTVIGTPKQPSPVFSNEMSYLEINPTWGLPNSIIAKEIIPKVKKDPEYLTKKRIRIYNNWSDKAKEIDPKKIDWAKINPEKFPYRMIQDSGVNPLGRIKFMFPNEFDVYLHDTTEKYLFKRQRRLFSHGCIRVEKPYDLGEWVLKNDPSWSRERIIAEIKKGKRLQVNLPRTVPVHVMYLTAWVDGNGLLQFRNDYYGYDKLYEDTLRNIDRPKTGKQESRDLKKSISMISPNH